MCLFFFVNIGFYSEIILHRFSSISTSPNFISLAEPTPSHLKKIAYCFLLFTSISFSQEYVDLLKIGYGKTLNNDFEGTSQSTTVQFFEADFTYPIVLNEKNTFITGASFNQNKLQLFPEAEHTNLYSTLLKIGLASTFNDRWSGTIVLLPKIASDYRQISGDDFYFGGIGLLKFQKTEHLKYRFGIYATSEAFGLFTTPIIGWYYLSPNKKFEMDMSLPIAADVNYDVGFATIGIDYFGIGRSYNLEKENQAKVYVDQSSLEFAGYIQFNTLQKSVLLRAKAGYATSNYEVYADGDTIDLGISAFSFGDNRTPLNPDLSGGLFLKFEAIYRFHIPAEKKETPMKK
jgi:hypothetical protein